MRIKRILQAAACIAVMLSMMTGCGNGSTATGSAETDISRTSDTAQNETDPEISKYLKLPASDGLEFEENGDGTCTVSGIGECEDTTLVIPTKSDNGSTVTGIEEYALYEGDITAVVFNGADLEVNNYAFADSDLTELIINDSILKLSDNAFAYCDDIEDININNSTLETDEFSFYECGDDAVLAAYDSTLNIGQSAFSSSDIISISIENCSTELDKNAFAYCDDIEVLTVKDGSFSVNGYGFYDSGSSTDVTFKDCDVEIKEDGMSSSGLIGLYTTGGTVNIGKNGFAYCEDLSKVTIGNGDLKVRDNAFYDCADGLKITYAGNIYSPDKLPG